MRDAAVGSDEKPNTVLPSPSSAAVLSSLCVAASVRGKSGIFGIAACSCATRSASVPSSCATWIAIGNSIFIAEMSVIGSWTSHCDSCALDGNVCSLPSAPSVV